jgi:hypothetical protein
LRRYGIICPPFVPQQDSVNQQQRNECHCANKLDPHLTAPEVLWPDNQETGVITDLDGSVIGEHRECVLQTGGYSAVSTAMGTCPK